MNRHKAKQVRRLQKVLNAILGTRLQVNGMMDPATRKAIRMFQARRGLPVNGIVGPETRHALIVAMKNRPRRRSDSHFFRNEPTRYQGELEAGRTRACPFPVPPPGKFGRSMDGTLWYTPQRGDYLVKVARRVLVMKLKRSGVEREPTPKEVMTVANAIKRHEKNKHLKGKWFLPRFGEDRCSTRGRKYGSIFIPLNL